LDNLREMSFSYNDFFNHSYSKDIIEYSFMV